LLPVVFASFTAPAFAQQQPVTPAALEGAWKLTSLSYDGKPQPATGYIVFHGSHYSYVTNRERPKLPNGVGTKPPEQLTAEENRAYVEAFRQMTAAAGRFSIEKDEIALVMEVVRTPNLAGQTERRKSWFENGKLVQDFTGGGQRQVYIWERVK
jgi:hypothetical protein